MKAFDELAFEGGTMVKCLRSNRSTLRLRLQAPIFAHGGVVVNHLSFIQNYYLILLIAWKAMLNGLKFLLPIQFFYIHFSFMGICHPLVIHL